MEVLTPLEVAERRQQADADVHRAVADREDRAVAGSGLPLRSLRRARTQSRTRRGGLQYVAIAVPYGHSWARTCRAPARIGCWRRRPRRRSGPAPPRARRCRVCTTAPRHEPPASTHRREGLGALGAGGTSLHGVHRHHPVEVAAAHGVAVAGNTGCGPRQLEGPALRGARRPLKRWHWPVRPRGMSCSCFTRRRSSGRRRTSSRAETSCARRRRRRGRGVRAGPQPKPRLVRRRRRGPRPGRIW